MNNIGQRVYGIAAVIMGVCGIVWAGFAVGWIPIAQTLPGRATFAYMVGALLVIGGVLINVRRPPGWGAWFLTAVFGIGLVLVDLTRLATHLTRFDYWESSAEQAAIFSGGLIALAMTGSFNAQHSAQLQTVGRIIFGVCLLIFGAAHFVYADFTASMVPKYIPPNTMFWTYATGVAHAAAGLALLSGILPLLAARLVVVMYALFGLLIHLPNIVAAPTHENWIENAVNLALVGVAWIVSESLAAKRT